MNKIISDFVNLIGTTNPEYSELQLKKMEYGLICFFNEITKLVLYYIIFYLLGLQGYYLVTLIFFCSLRLFTGGYHAKTYWRCFFISLLILSSIIFIGKNVILSYTAVILLLAVSLIFMIIFSPVDNENKRIISRERKMRLKLCSVIILFFLILLIYFIPVKYTATAVISITTAVFLMLVGALLQLNKAKHV